MPKHVKISRSLHAVFAKLAQNRFTVVDTWRRSGGVLSPKVVQPIAGACMHFGRETKWCLKIMNSVWGFISQNTFLHGFDQEPDAKRSHRHMMQVRGYEYIRAARSAEEKLNHTERGLAKVEPCYASGALLCEM